MNLSCSPTSFESLHATLLNGVQPQTGVETFTEESCHWQGSGGSSSTTTSACQFEEWTAQCHVVQSRYDTRFFVLCFTSGNDKLWLRATQLAERHRHNCFSRVCHAVVFQGCNRKFSELRLKKYRGKLDRNAYTHQNTRDNRGI